MKIDEAIDWNKEMMDELIREGRTEKANAIKLGIEALKLVKRLRHPEFLRYLCLLPGETED